MTAAFPAAGVFTTAPVRSEHGTVHNRNDRETRLSMRAVQIIDNGDPDEIAAFADELLAHATAELAGR